MWFFQAQVALPTAFSYCRQLQIIILASAWCDYSETHLSITQADMSGGIPLFRGVLQIEQYLQFL